MFGIVVYEIVAQREPHANADPNQVAILIRWVCCLFVSMFFLSFFMWQTSYFDFCRLNTEMKDWHQQFLQIVLRNLLNWCKCVGRNNLNNVLYLFSLFLVSLFHTNSTIWFFSSLIEMLIGFWNNSWNVGTIEIELLFLWQNGTLYVRVS
jgi:hypothetical protein